MAKATPFSITETSDLPTVRDLAHRIWPISYTNFLTPEQIENMLARIYDLDALRAEAAQGHRFFLAQHNNEPVGYASAYPEGDTAWLKKLYLLPECRGSGLGAELLAAALAVFPHASEQRLLVNPENHAALRFYERLGFACVGEKQVQMGDYRFNDLIYTRRICAP
jgi:ribosomal protein S18 acetylase RimI-like enzyme